MIHKTVHTLTHLHEAFGSRFDGRPLTKLTDRISVSLVHDEFHIYVDGKFKKKLNPKMVVKELKEMVSAHKYS